MAVEFVFAIGPSWAGDLGTQSQLRLVISSLEMCYKK